MTITQSLLSNPEETLETVVGMTPVKRTLEKVEADEENSESQTEKEEEENDFEGQLTQLEAMFTLDKVFI